MKYQLFRLVAVTINREIPVSRWICRLDDVYVHSIDHPPLTKDPGTLFLLAAGVELSSKLLMDGTEILVPSDLRRKLEETLETMANLLAVTHQCGRTIRSTIPYVAIDPIDEEAKQWISAATAIQAAKEGVPDRMQHALDLNTVIPLLTDRLDGAALLAEALCQDHPTGKLHEYMRLFERAFARPAGDVCRDLLVDFLTPLRYGYDANEINHWLHLRHLSTHADKRLDYAVESDTRPVVNRLEQAAFDVLFNKEKWRDPAIARRKVFHPIYGSLSSHGSKMFMALDAKGDARALVSFPFFDGFSAYPLDLRLDLSRCVPQNWFTKTTDVKAPADKEVPVMVEAAPPSLGNRRNLSACDLLHSGLVGMWAERSDIGDSREFARRLREQAQTRRQDG